MSTPMGLPMGTPSVMFGNVKLTLTTVDLSGRIQPITVTLRGEIPAVVNMGGSVPPSGAFGEAHKATCVTQPYSDVPPGGPFSDDYPPSPGGSPMSPVGPFGPCGSPGCGSPVGGHRSPRVGRRIVATAVTEHRIGTVGPAPHDHLAPRPHRRRHTARRGCIRGRRGQPLVAGGVQSTTRV